MKTPFFFGLTLFAVAIVGLPLASLEAANYNRILAKVTYVPHDHIFVLSWGKNAINIRTGNDVITVVLKGTAVGTNAPNEEFIHFAPRSSDYQAKNMYVGLSSVNTLEIYSTGDIDARIERPWFASPSVTEGKFKFLSQTINDLKSGQEYRVTLKGDKGRESHGFLTVTLEPGSGTIRIDIKIYDKELNDLLRP